MKAILKAMPLLLLLFLSVLALSIGNRGPGLVAQQEKKVEAKQIPLESIYSTSRQEGLKRFDQAHGDQGFRDLYQRSTGMGASNVFLARGDDIVAAVKATWLVFMAGHPADSPVAFDRDSRSDHYWLVAYLGVAGSSPLAWRVESVQVDAAKVRINYRRGTSETDDELPYFLWAPLGKLSAGPMALELHDAENGRARLVRRVDIPAK
jgi:hypothetical protein